MLCCQPMKILLLLLSVSCLFVVSGCSSLPPLPAGASDAQDRIMDEIRLSLGHRHWSFDALLAKTGNPPYYQRKVGQAPAHLAHGNGARQFAPGVSDTDVRNVGVKEYAFFLGPDPGAPSEEEPFYRCVRVFVRKDRVIYMEWRSVWGKNFWIYFERAP